ncbi:hypothetical protein M409DRAFT_35272 [Zasmidium cellare ATCC 36951]|uniref:RNA helicase n=1 Tax=Zasmidium cellare ATCC 36951 TaxID=1080233 RepID=A0A6A6D6G0_ZASCE|nr:uncharacterized protein M409DRAFT_35272 [Zasmidium cellare ATCC 36951]KAF2173812.1 hypothetical protein M409DRAFT_35272 [Zasmidium cellare ATCC 36951]
MGKRSRDEAEAASEVTELSSKKQKVKKDKKEKKEKKAKLAAENVADGVEDEDAAAKAEKKARKRAEKAAKKAAKANGAATEEEDVDVSKNNGKTVTGVSKAEGDAYYKEKQIAVEDPLKEALGPVLSFDSLPFDKETRKAYFSGFSTPTPIQAASWPYLLNGRDMIGVAETGSGKTFAFGVPCINRLKKDVKRIQVCIVSPTRELALQIQEQMTKLAKPKGLKATCVYGGMSKDDQRQALKGAHIVVATPGRLNDFIGDGTIDLSNTKYLVLDEADRMLDTGFEQDIRKIITAAADGKDRQTLMFTATWPESVRKLASEFLRNPVRITIGDNASGELRANTRIVQEVEVIEEMQKQSRLFDVLRQYQSGKNKKDRILVFCLYKKEATRVEESIRRRGFPVAGIHGDLSQQKRMESLEAFKNGEVPCLVATDVAARGLDIPAVKVVINVTFPLTVEDYVHRIGRTGRAGQDGRAITFFTQNEKGLAGALINVLKKADQPVPEELMKFGTTVKKKGHDAYGAFFKDTSDAKTATKITFD